MKKYCPICCSIEIEYLYETEVPILQNRVYASKENALRCIQGSINLGHCLNCNFTFNGSFEEDKIIYDEEYDNAVPSKLFSEYYQSICEYLYEKYHLEGGIVYDIGCGKGKLLEMLCEMYPNITAIGIDPSYEGELNPVLNLTFIQDFFKQEHVIGRPSLILSRHVFEHIEFPKDFLRIIYDPLSLYHDVPIFIEVPDFQWIVENKTFWDLCYEHCNYFSEKSLQEVFNNSWSVLNMITKSFSNQYLWIEGVLNPTIGTAYDFSANKILESDIHEFIDSIQNAQKKIHALIMDYKGRNFNIVVWGMATKGVIFTNNIDIENKIVDYCIDINSEKQNKYSPISGHFIHSPEKLLNLTGAKFLIIVMNTNYFEEIKYQVMDLTQNATFIDAHGNEL